MTAEQILQPKLRFPEFDGELRSKIIGDVCNLTTGNKDTQNKIDDGKYPFFVRSQTVERINSYSYNGEAILTSGDGVGVGKNFHYINGKFDFHQRVYCLNKFKDDVYGQFVFHYFSENFLRRITRMNAKNSVDSVRREMIFDMPILLPSLHEQTKIANFLSSIDEKIILLKEKKALLEEYKKGMMQKIFNQEIRFKDDNGNNFEDWEEKVLGDFKDLIHGDGDWILSKDLSIGGKYKLIQLGNIGFGNYVDKNLKSISLLKFNELKGTLLKKGDLLINRMVDSNLYCCLLDKEGDYITSVDVCWIRENLYFSNYFFMSLILFKENQIKLLNLSSGSGRVRISKSNFFNEFKFSLPSILEQTKIANFLSSIDKKIALVATQIEDTQEYKKGLLQQMFV
ncbi:restriction endonuclease subunit S [Flavobacterium sp. EDS]|uniref:restriction endonuclease subunit S n=1 Tax=Flavobacterium sp. EDS TaxID=2897328 RepID=UPI001E324EAC|nr:restriction endonuclease subunit S [Flavobacterium sp. EDS]MCD0474403.1 restriction endonuclease subunit S [Flavobacterium sp. EDS]